MVLRQEDLCSSRRNLLSHYTMMGVDRSLPSKPSRDIYSLWGLSEKAAPAGTLSAKTWIEQGVDLSEDWESVENMRLEEMSEVLWVRSKPMDPGVVTENGDYFPWEELVGEADAKVLRLTNEFDLIEEEMLNGTGGLSKDILSGGSRN